MKRRFAAPSLRSTWTVVGLIFAVLICLPVQPAAAAVDGSFQRALQVTGPVHLDLTTGSALLGGLLAAAVLVVVLLPHGKSHPVAWRDVSRRGRPGADLRRDRAAVSDAGAVQGVLRLRQAQAPVDFSTRQLLLVSPGPRSSTGYSVRSPERDRAGRRDHRQGPRAHTAARRPRRAARDLSVPADQPPGGQDVYVDWVGR